MVAAWNTQLAGRALEAHKVPFVVQNISWGSRTLEPLISSLHRHDEPARKIGAPSPEFVVLRRKVEDGLPSQTPPRAG